MGAPKASDHIAVLSFRIGVFLVDEGDATETAHQSRHEILIGQIAFQAYALHALTVEEEYSRCRPTRRDKASFQKHATTK